MVRVATCLTLLSALLISVRPCAAVSFEQVQPSPRQTHYDPARAPFQLTGDAPVTVRLPAALKTHGERFAEEAGRLVGGLRVSVAVDGALAAHAVAISTKPDWRGPEIWPAAPRDAEGYALHISGNGIAIVGTDADGVDSGLKTVLQLFMQARDQNAPIPAGRIVDWPAIQERSILLSLRKLRGNHDLAYLQRVLAACGTLKYNSVFLEFNSAAPGERYPFPVTVPEPLTDAQLRTIRETAERHGLKVNLYFQFGGHCKWLLDEPAFAGFSSAVEKPLSWDNSNWCPLQPQLWEVVEDLLKRQVAAFQPQWIHIAHDEIGHGEFGTTPAAKSSGLSREALIGRSLESVRDVAARVQPDAKLMLWHDLLIPDQYKSPSRVGFVDGQKLLDLVPPGMTVGIWKYEGDEELIPLTQYFSERNGRQFWLTTFQAETAFKVAAYAANQGGKGLLSTHWYEAPGCTWNDPRGISAAAMNAVVASAAAAWNPEYDAARTTTLDRVALFRQLVEGIKAADAQSTAWVHAASPESSGPAAAEYRDPVLKELVRVVPQTLVAPNGVPFERFSRPLAVSEGEAGSPRITVDRPVTAVHFLHATERPDAASGLNSWQRGSETPRIGEYRLHFRGGEPVTIPLQYRWNIQNWNAKEGAYGCRVAWAGTFGGIVQAQLTTASWQSANGQPRHLEYIELVGVPGAKPRPHLWGVTMATPGEVGDGTGADGFAARVFEDQFSYASTAQLKEAWSGFSGRLTQVAPDAKNPSHAVITLPATPSGASPSRLDIGKQGMQLDTASANALSLNIRSTAGTDDAVTMIIYLGNTKAEKGSYYLAYHIPLPSTEWKRITLPLDGARTEGTRPGTNASTFDTLKLSFWHRNAKPVEIGISDLVIGQYVGPEIYNPAVPVPTRTWLPAAGK